MPLELYINLNSHLFIFVFEADNPILSRYNKRMSQVLSWAGNNLHTAAQVNQDVPEQCFWEIFVITAPDGVVE